jgi:hypothetical protein
VQRVANNARQAKQRRQHMHKQLLVDNGKVYARELTNGRAVLGSIEQQEVVGLLCVERLSERTVQKLLLVDDWYKQSMYTD